MQQHREPLWPQQHWRQPSQHCQPNLHVVKTRSTPRGNYLRNEHAHMHQRHACIFPVHSATHASFHLLPAVCFVTGATTHDQSENTEALTLSPMSTLLKQKVLRWLLDAFTAGSIVSRNTFSTYWQM